MLIYNSSGTAIRLISVFTKRPEAWHPQQGITLEHLVPIIVQLILAILLHSRIVSLIKQFSAQELTLTKLFHLCRTRLSLFILKIWEFSRKKCDFFNEKNYSDASQKRFLGQYKLFSQHWLSSSFVWIAQLFLSFLKKKSTFFISLISHWSTSLSHSKKAKKGKGKVYLKKYGWLSVVEEKTSFWTVMAFVDSFDTVRRFCDWFFLC